MYDPTLYDQAKQAITNGKCDYRGRARRKGHSASWPRTILLQQVARYEFESGDCIGKAE